MFIKYKNEIINMSSIVKICISPGPANDPLDSASRTDAETPPRVPSQINFYCATGNASTFGFASWESAQRAFNWICLACKDGDLFFDLDYALEDITKEATEYEQQE